MLSLLKTYLRIAAVLLVGLWLGVSRLWADGREVAVVYNSLLPESKAVAEHYAAARAVPAGQVFGLPLTTNEEITRVYFQEALERPLAKELTARKLWKYANLKIPATSNHPPVTGSCVVQSRIRYLVLCYGVPLKIA